MGYKTEEPIAAELLLQLRAANARFLSASTVACEALAFAESVLSSSRIKTHSSYASGQLASMCAFNTLSPARDNLDRVIKNIAAAIPQLYDIGEQQHVAGQCLVAA